MSETRKEKVLRLLMEARAGESKDGWVESWRICSPEWGGLSGLRRLRELRAEGYAIESRALNNANNGTFLYRLKHSEPEQMEIAELKR